ncbi:MAG: hypothetical protein K5665_09060, partial [Saccharofermentans sp.]|nr:hypothetical protein [Saccharofermentans sp.]
MIDFAKRIVSAFVAGAVVFGTIAVYPSPFDNKSFVNAATLYDSASLVNYSTILGRAKDYGIIARSFTQSDHMETTLATSSYKRTVDSNIDVDLTTSKTAQFIIGEIQGRGNMGTIKFGTVHGTRPASSTYVKNINITFAKEIFGNSTNYSSKVKKQDDVAQTTEFNYSILSKAEIDYHINSIVSHAEDESDKMVKRTNNPDYVLDSSVIKVNNTTKVTSIDLDKDIYENRVVYVDLNNSKFSTLLGKWRSDPGGNYLDINKRSSTVVVFTYTGSNSITLGKVQVIAKDSKYYSSAGSGLQQSSEKYSSVTTWSGNISGHNNYVDHEMAQKLIWNIPNSTNVTITGNAGTFLITKENAQVKVSGSPSSGWIITKGNVENKCEFHYIYGGANSSLQSEGNGQMHFVAHKNFTSEYRTKNEIAPYVDNTVILKDGDYEFYWQEYTDGTFTQTYGSRATIPIDSKSVVEFPTLTIRTDSSDSHYKIEKNQTRDFYFRISENPDKSVLGYVNNVGYIDVRLRAKADKNGTIDFVAQSRTYIGDDSNNLILYSTNGVWGSDKESDWIDVVGNRFDLGAFYNRKVIPGYINITKTIKGEVTEEDLKGLTFVVKDGNTIVGSYALGKDFVKNSSDVYELKTPITVSDYAKKYTIEETLHTAAGFDVSVSYTVDGGAKQTGETATLNTVSQDSKNPTVVAYENDYTHIPGYINITKTIKGEVTEEDLKGLTFVVKDGNTIVGSYALGKDFIQTAAGEYELKTPIQVSDYTKKYTIEETLHTAAGFDVSVSYTV